MTTFYLMNDHRFSLHNAVHVTFKAIGSFNTVALLHLVLAVLKINDSHLIETNLSNLCTDITYCTLKGEKNDSDTNLL